MPTYMEPTILYEDTDIIAVNKPAGLVVHSDGRTQEPSVAEWFVHTYPEAAGVGEPIILTSPNPLLGKERADTQVPGEVGQIERPGIVHRIDRETSGVLLLAKTAAGHAHLKAQFQAHSIEKVYEAFLYGNLKEDHGTINKKISRSKSDFRKRVAGREGREAITYFRVLKRLPAEAGMPEATFVEAKPKTGRTHQIRVHFRALHHPVVADSLYAPGKPGLLGFMRLALHAKSIAFTDTKGEKHTIEAPYPEDFKQAIDKLK